MPQQKLYGPQISGSAVNEGRFGSAQRIRAKEVRIQPDAGNPLGDQPGILSRRYRLIPTATTGEEKLTRSFVRGSEVVVDGFSSRPSRS
jgi:hypothetical protein